jgi:hypothetical protein
MKLKDLELVIGVSNKYIVHYSQCILEASMIQLLEVTADI